MTQREKKVKRNQRSTNLEDLSIEAKQDKKSSNPWAILLAVLTALATIIAIINGTVQLGRDVKEVRATLTPNPTATLTFTPIPTITPLFTPGPLTFIELPREILAGTNVKVVVQAWQGASCFLEFFTKDGNVSTAGGLGVTTPDHLGHCIWNWRVNANTHEGMGKLVVHVGEFVEEHPLDILPAK